VRSPTTIDEGGLAGPQCTLEGRAKLFRPLDVLTVTIHELEYPVVALGAARWKSLQMHSCRKVRELGIN
jgi:hypothetical protein